MRSMRDIESLRRACETVRSYIDKPDYTEIVQECREELATLFRAGEITEPQHDELLQVMFPPNRMHKPYSPKAVGDQFPTVDNNLSVYPVRFPVPEQPPPRAA